MRTVPLFPRLSHSKYPEQRNVARLCHAADSLHIRCMAVRTGYPVFISLVPAFLFRLVIIQNSGHFHVLLTVYFFSIIKIILVKIR